jgi:hypothetical protein
VVVLLLVIAGAVIAATDPFGGGPSGTGVTDNSDATSITTVSQRSLSSQTNVNATLAYAGLSPVLLPGGTAPTALTQDQQKVATDQTALSAAQAALANTETSNQESLAAAQGSLSADQAGLAADTATRGQDQSTLSAAQQKEQIDCQGDAAASSSQCTSDTQLVAADQTKVAGDTQAVSTDQTKVAGDEAQISATGTMNQGKLGTAEAQVTAAQQTLSADQSILATDRSSAAAYGQSSTYTALPAAGQVVTEGHSLFSVNGQAVPLLYGGVTPWRAFSPGMSSGTDVAELDQSLAALGYGARLSGQDTFTAATAGAIDRLQGGLGLPETGQLPLGSVVFEPGAVRVTSVTPSVGAAVTAGPVLGVTTTARVVTIELDAAEQAEVKVGDKVLITLPNNETTPGVISTVGTVATTPSGGGNPSITVLVTPTDPAATGSFDQAPVEVSITTAFVEDALVVPVDSLLALANGGYALEVVSARGVHTLEPVTTGLFDGADGLVQVRGSGVVAGQRIVVPGT